jgi:hypothetical protein
MAASSTISRRFHLLDFIILIVAIAVGGALSRYACSGWPDRDLMPEYIVFPSLLGYSYYPIILSSCLWPISVALLILRAFRPRPQYAYRCPGMVSCVSTTAGMVLASAPAFCKFVQESRFPWAQLEVIAYANFRLALTVSFTTSIVITVSWITLALCGLWRLGGDWIERVGCLTGFCGIAVYPLWLLLGPYEMFVWY